MNLDTIQQNTLNSKNNGGARNSVGRLHYWEYSGVYWEVSFATFRAGSPPFGNLSQVASNTAFTHYPGIPLLDHVRAWPLEWMN
jgi:hypothetical protein